MGTKKKMLLCFSSFICCGGFKKVFKRLIGFQSADLQVLHSEKGYAVCKSKHRGFYECFKTPQGT